jgi:hypothetical protein
MFEGAEEALFRLRLAEVFRCLIKGPIKLKQGNQTEEKILLSRRRPLKARHKPGFLF